jgi:hypothetical protein
MIPGNRLQKAQKALIGSVRIQGVAKPGDRNSVGRAVVSPPEGGVATPIKQMSRYLSLGVAGEVITLAATGV